MFLDEKEKDSLKRKTDVLINYHEEKMQVLRIIKEALEKTTQTESELLMIKAILG